MRNCLSSEPRARLSEPHKRRGVTWASRIRTRREAGANRRLPLSTIRLRLKRKQAPKNGSGLKFNCRCLGEFSLSVVNVFARDFSPLRYRSLHKETEKQLQPGHNRQSCAVALDMTVCKNHNPMRNS